MKTIKYLCSNCFENFSLKDKEKQICPNCGKRLSKRDNLPTVAQFKKRVWTIFSKYIRLRDCLETTGSKQEGVCYTCGKTYPFKSLQSGHMVTGRKDNVLFDENYVKIQCYSCNIHLGGNQGKFVLKRMKELIDSGMTYKEAYDEIDSVFNRKEKHYNIDELIEIYKEYENKYERLVNI